MELNSPVFQEIGPSQWFNLPTSPHLPRGFGNKLPTALCPWAEMLSIIPSPSLKTHGEFWLFYFDFIWRQELLFLTSPGMMWVRDRKWDVSCLWVLASHLKAAACFWLATGGIPRTLGPLDSYYVFILLRRQASSSPLSAWLIMSDCGHLVTQLWVHLYFL